MQVIDKVQTGSFSKVRISKLVFAVASVFIALIAIFPLAAWAEAAEWHHGVQHVLIFLAGTGLGAILFGNRFTKGRES